MADFKKLEDKLKRMERYLENDLPTIIGGEAVNHFKDSFQNQGFTDKTLERWPDVKRRDPHSPWHGFKVGQRFSSAAASRPILSGETQNLIHSLRWQKTTNGVLITAGTKYAKIHNEGGAMKVFGRGGHTMPKRQFMGDSKVLRERIIKSIKTDIKRILS